MVCGSVARHEGGILQEKKYHQGQVRIVIMNVYHVLNSMFKKAKTI